MPIYNWLFFAAFSLVLLATTHIVQLETLSALLLLALAACCVAIGIWELESEDSRLP